MVVLVLAMLICLALGSVVVGYVAVEAHRDGRDVLTPEADHVLAGVRRRGEDLREHGDQLRRTLQPAGRR